MEQIEGRRSRKTEHNRVFVNFLNKQVIKCNRKTYKLI